MIHMEDTLKVVADLQPASLDRLADEGYARRRDADLARLTAGPAWPAKRGLAKRGRVLTVSLVGVAAAAVAVTLTVTTSPSPSDGPVSAHASLDARTVLLASAHAAGQAPAVTGTFWYVRERDFEPAAPQAEQKSRGKSPQKVAKPTGLSFGAFFAATQETWFGPSATRTIVNEDLAFNFASPADKARWQAAGSPKLSNPAGRFGNSGPVTSNYDFGGYSYRIGALQVSLVKAGKLPTTAAGLGSLLRRQWDNLSAEQKAATTGFAKPTYPLYLFQVAGALLTGPVTPGTRAAVYELLASQPGLTVAAHVTDPLGRAGTAVGDGAGDYLVIDPATATVLAQTTYPVHQGHAIPPTAGGTEAYEAMGWTNHLGTPASS